MPPKISAFMLYVKEWRLENDPKMSLQEAIQEAGKTWETMSYEDRQPYIDKCTELRVKQQEDNKRNRQLNNQWNISNA